MGEASYIAQRTMDRLLFSRTPVALIAIIIAVAIVVYWRASMGLWAYWTEQPSLGGHGPLVILIATCLLVRAQRTSARSRSAGPDLPWH